MRLLLLAGTGEAVALAREMAVERVPVIASLAGATRAPRDLGVPTRIGGWGGAEAFSDWLRREAITGILDATHPFAYRISVRTAQVAGAQGMPYCQVLRPEWAPEAGDRWTFLAREEEAAAHIPEGATVFLATGRQTLHRFAGLTGRELICRQIDPPEGPFPFENGRYLLGRPPFSVADEMALFAELGVDWLVVKNAGGDLSRSKLDAARALGLDVAMIDRPAQPEATRVADVAGAMAWVRAWMNG